MTIEEMYGNAKALVEDRTYNIGEVSEKTGLQKTANGWVKPKSNKSAKKDASEKGMSKHWVQKGEEAAFVERTPQEEKEMWKKVAARQSDEKLQLAIKNRQGKDLTPIEKIKLETAKAELEKRSGKSTSIPFNPKTLEYKEKNSKGEWETKKFEPEELLEEMQEMRKEYKTANKKDSLEQIDREIAGLQEYIKNQNKTTDSACRITADTKIRLKK